MREIKDTPRAVVRIGYDGRVHKKFSGAFAKKRYENEVRVLNYLEGRRCPFVPRILETHPEDLYFITTNCGAIVEDLSEKKAAALFDELEDHYGVRHDDRAARNITYNARLGRFCVIDFEFAVILETGEGLTLKETLQ